jgi:lysozyme
MSYHDIVFAQLAVDEGKRNRMYLDSRGIPTIGIGHNLRDKPISDAAVRAIFEDDLADAEADAKRIFACFDKLSDARKAVVVNMAFNMGYATLSQFKHTIAMVDAGRYDEAAEAMLQSRWATQVGARAERLADAMRKG